ncbi:MAG: hypothetical protein WKF31_03060 [Thermoleophilaceae bacterium]
MDALVTETHLRAGVAGLRAAGRGGLGVVAVGAIGTRRRALVSLRARLRRRAGRAR